MHLLKNNTVNILFTVVISIICFIALHSSNALENAGMAAIILNWVPFIIGFCTLVVYLLCRLITKKYAWIVTILGNLMNISILLSSIFS